MDIMIQNNMRDVAKKCSEWRKQSAPDIKQIIRRQREFLQFLRRHGHGVNGKHFADFENVSNWTYKQKTDNSVINVVSIYDQLFEVFAWFDRINVDDFNILQAAEQNLVFELIDIFHFVINIAIIWEVQDKVKQLVQSGRTYDSFQKPYAILNRLTNQLLNCFSWKYWKGIQYTDKQKLVSVIDNMIRHLVAFSKMYGITRTDFRKMYSRKNKQNIDRQKNNPQYKN